MLDGVYVQGPDQLEFRRVAPPTKVELEGLLKTVTVLDHLVGLRQERLVRCQQRLKRVFGIEIETCAARGGKVRVIASIEDPAVIGKMLGRRRPAYVAARDPAPLPKAGSTMDRRRTPNP